MKLNKKMMTLALAGAMLTMTVCGAQAKELKGGMKNGAVAGLKNGMTNGMTNGAAEGLKSGTAEGLKNGMADGVKDGMKNGVVGGMTNGLKNGMVNGFVNGDVQQALDAEALAKLLESGELTQEQYDALIAAMDSASETDSNVQTQIEQ